MTGRAVRSFDVFDTCVARTRARPEEVIEAVVAGLVPRDAPDRLELIADVARRRLSAEVDARAALDADAVGIGQIYDQLGDLSDAGLDNARLLDAELAFERSESRPVRAGIERVGAARRTGARIVFISDMYLPEDLIRELLLAFGAAEPGDGLYVSGTLGVSKASGALFGRVLAGEGIDAGDLIHCGDDAWTDDAVPRRLGIGVEPLVLARPNRLEAEMSARSSSDRLTRARVTGLARAVRVAHSDDDRVRAAGTALIADVVAPLLTGFVAWVLETARADGVERLHFVSRDAQIMLAIARELAGPDAPECSYLYGSRHAWFLPGVERLDRDGLRFVLEPTWGLRTPRTLLAKLDLDAAELAGPLGAHGLEPDQVLDAEGIERFWALVDELRPTIEAGIAGARELAVEYLDQEGVTGPRPAALVDIGWNLSSQSALRQMLSAAGREEAVRGYYLGAGRWRKPISRSGPFRAYCREDHRSDHDYLPEAWLLRNSSLVEQVFTMADHGSCIGYRRAGDRVEPVLRDWNAAAGQQDYVRHLHATVVAFAREVAGTPLAGPDHAVLRHAALAAGRLAIEEPRREDAQALAWLPVGDDQNDSRVRPLAEPLGLSDLSRKVKVKLRRMPRDAFADSTWREGSVALSPAPYRTAFRAGKRLSGAPPLRRLVARIRG